MKRIILLLLWSIVICNSLHAQTSPNIIFIVIDDLNDYVEGFNGHPQVLTPAFKELETKGFTFTNGFCTAPGCAPSRTSFMSGKDVEYTQVYNNSDYTEGFRNNFTPENNNEEVFTLPGILKDSGNYFTVDIGKIFHSKSGGDMDFETPDECEKEKAWNKFISIQEGPEFVSLGISYSEYPTFGWAKIPDSLETQMEDYIGTDSAIQFLNDYVSGTEEACGKPFFLALGYHEPHTGRMIPAKYFPEHYTDDIYEYPLDIAYNSPVNAYPYNGIIMPPQPTVKWGDYYALPAGGMAQSLADDGSLEPKISEYITTLTPLPNIASGLTYTQRIAIIEETQRANNVIAYIAAVQFVDAQIGRLLETINSHPELENTIIILVSDHGFSLGEKKTLYKMDIMGNRYSHSIYNS